jgi:hypothetical protein
MDKYPRTYHFDFSPGTTSDDRIAKDFSNIIGVPIVITEKLDGENNSMISDGVYARSHTDFTISPWSSKVRELHGILKHSISKDLYIFGEAMSAIHSIEYENLISHFYMFGARYKGVWSSWEEVEEYAYLLDLPTVPVLFKGTIKDYKELKTLVEKLVSEPSSLGGIKEGVVARIAAEFNDDEFSNSVFKWVRKDHVQTDEHWTKNWVWSKIKLSPPYYL